MQIEKVMWPDGPADVKTPDASASPIAVTIENRLTILTLNQSIDATLNLTVDEGIEEGALLLVKAASDGTARALTYGTAIDAPAIAGTINKTKSQLFMYDGSTFIPAGAIVQVN